MPGRDRSSRRAYERSAKPPPDRQKRRRGDNPHGESTHRPPVAQSPRRGQSGEAHLGANAAVAGGPGQGQQHKRFVPANDVVPAGYDGLEITLESRSVAPFWCEPQGGRKKTSQLRWCSALSHRSQCSTDRYAPFHG